MNRKKIAGIGFAGILCVATIVLFIKDVTAPHNAPSSNQKNAQAQKESFLQEGKKAVAQIELGKKNYEIFDTYETYLILGTDASGNENTENDSYRGSMADFLLLAVFNKTKDTYACIQLNRDTMTEVQLLNREGKGEATAKIQLCTAHWYGGTKEQSCENTVTAVSKMFGGLPIDGYYALGMEKIAKLNHLAGGVKVTIQDDFSKIDASMKKGTTITLSDKQAYTYVHVRYNVGSEDNLSRMSRQREYMKSLFETVQKKTKETPNTINKIYKGLKNDAVTDMNGKKISKLTNFVSKGTYLGMYMLEGKATLGKALGDNVEHVEYHVDEKSKISILTEIYGLQEGKENNE